MNTPGPAASADCFVMFCSILSFLDCFGGEARWEGSDGRWAEHLCWSVVVKKIRKMIHK